MPMSYSTSKDTSHALTQAMDRLLREQLKRLSELALVQGSLTTGRVRIMATDLFKNSLGDKWQKFEARVCDRLEAEMEEHLAPGDICLRTERSRFLVIFEKTTLDEANVVLGRIVARVLEHFIGVEGVDQLLEVITEEVKGTDLMRSARFLEKIGDLRDRVPANIEALENEDDEAAGKKAGKAAPAISHSAFQPFWDSAHQAIVSHIVQISAATPDGYRGYGYIVMSPRLKGLERDAIDCLIAADSLHLADDLYRENVIAPLILPLSFATASREDRLQNFLSIIENISPAARRTLGVELLEFPVGVNPMALKRIVDLLKARIRWVLMLTGPEYAPHFGDIQTAGIGSVGLSALNMRSLSTPSLKDRFGLFVHAARRARLRSHVHGLSTLEMAVAGYEAGFDYLTGDFIAPRLKTPMAVARRNWSSIKEHAED